MIIRHLRIVVLLAVCLIAGCTGTLMPVGSPAPIEDRGQTDAATEPGPDIEAPSGLIPGQSDTSIEPGVFRKHDPIVGSRDLELHSDFEAVYTLAQRAEKLVAQGDTATAVATIERALRIEPSNPWLWYRLANLHFEHGDLDQAQATARRSNALARNSPGLVRANDALLKRIESLGGNAVDVSRRR